MSAVHDRVNRRPAHVFVLGLDDRNRALLEDLPDADAYRFHPLLPHDELVENDSGLDLRALLERAEAELTAYGGPVDGITGYWDFPVTSMVPILCARRGLPSPSLASVLRCENKYWSRLEQGRVSDALPPFALVDLADPRPPAGLAFPMWLKPIKSRSSELAFKVEDAEQLAAAARAIGNRIGRVGTAFGEVMSLVEPPAGVARAGGAACLAEEEISGRQVTVEGWALDGRVEVYGVVDSVPYPGTSSFLRYQYPSSLPPEVQQRLADTSRRVIRGLGLDRSTFNIEYFWDAERDRIDIVEVNPRLSQSHAPLFRHVDGVSNLHCMVALALGRDPHRPGLHREPSGVAAKWYLRRFSDARVRRAPGPADLARVRQEAPEAIVDIVAREGRRLSDLPMQDSYSYELAALHLRAEDEAALEAKFRRCAELLPFAFDGEETGPAPVRSAPERRLHPLPGAAAA